ncbi:Rid family hydrolase [Rheinheimera sp. 1928-s]|uniref:Rid family hydrolase n=1 Tax=Rheinheimera sp. 1928-s TaxID=3033803 RepID=UPI00261916A3|nr:Rid family hydrolase [Rheinheimera sp. 1928-s]MDF3124544.1 Rid family hydrolase [Rheinheimera sp. 1928-s]
MKSLTKLALLSLCVASSSLMAEVKRYPLPDNSTFPIANAVEVNKLVFESGKVPAPKDPKAAKGSVEFWGNTEEQTLNVLSQIESSLKQKGLGMGDVIKMTVFLVGDPALGGKMDFANCRFSGGWHVGRNRGDRR